MTTDMDTSTKATGAGSGSLQLGIEKYLYTGYFVAGCLIAWFTHNLVVKFFGENRDTIGIIVGVLAGVLGVVFGWRSTRMRGLAQDTIHELAEVTWPTRQETSTATVVVVTTSVVSAVVIFGLDRFWNWMTNAVFAS